MTPQLLTGGVKGRERGRKREKRVRGRKREDILQGKAVIYEQVTSNKQGEGDTPSPIKPGEAEEAEGKSQRERLRFKGRGTVDKRKVGGKLVPDEPEQTDLNDSGMLQVQWYNKTPQTRKG